jgi:hypothetical protein
LHHVGDALAQLFRVAGQERPPSWFNGEVEQRGGLPGLAMRYVNWPCTVTA